MIESEYSELKKMFSLNEVASRLAKRYEIRIDDVLSLFEVVKADVNDGTIELEVVQSSTYSDKLFQIDARKSFKMHLG